MRGRVDWTGGNGLLCTNANGQSIELDWEDGPSPMQITLQMIGACSLVDVVIGLKERPFTKVWVELDSTRAEQSPRVFKTVEMTYHVEGDVPEKLFERIVAKSHEKLCSVSNMFIDVEMTSKVVIHRD
ncbi:MAG: OsmC family protein [Euryarchaeota archaeon]|jgi:putative redox protein|nr:OsmC family protein [Euryarchaeota archaeon]HJL97868.1 OsmC family protein [Candidatus Poseidoniaceae archaeon]MBT5595246.1 OsmC family protein [Euryarchaeota archaeon]MBT5844482.1 OsmC family protein [Euryarchaeota archaeon]MBT6640330.1 OsmC family protein [Euryarchaeota archaeon]